jgi:hypothetical protein
MPAFQRMDRMGKRFPKPGSPGAIADAKAKAAQKAANRAALKTGVKAIAKKGFKIVPIIGTAYAVIDFFKSDLNGGSIVSQQEEQAGLRRLKQQQIASSKIPTKPKTQSPVKKTKVMRKK